ncbi:MAG: ABC transporter permease [Chloroflexi bacterium]|nr:ABC transporter permease [Chloroflexota bacterium]MCL5074478.1 ABC transporter permease [Chloroflexota bacterium]
MNLGAGYRWRAVAVLQGKELRTMVFGIGIYLALVLALSASALVLRNYLGVVAEKGVAVMSRPLYVPLFISVLLSALYLAISSCTAISRERDQGTLEVLFYGPVDHLSYVLSKYVAHLLAYLLMAFFYVLSLWLLSLVTNLVFSAELLWAVLLSVGTVSGMIAFGLFLSAFTRRVRTSLMLFAGVTLIFLAIQLGYEVLAGLPAQGRSHPFLYLRDVLVLLNHPIEWLSPFSFLTRGIDAVWVGNVPLYVTIALFSIGYTILLLFLGVIALKQKGVRA